MSKLSIFDEFDDHPKLKPTRAKRPKVVADQFSLFDVDPMAQPASSFVELNEGFCPNLFPTITANYKLAIIGEAPGEDECRIGEPFIGHSGRFLDQVLSRANILRTACFIGNICQHRPPRNDISLFSREGEYITAGLTQLTTNLATFDPNLCLLLGRTALWAAKGTDKIDDWKCSFFIGDKSGPFFGRKCIATFHPAFALRQYADASPWITFAVQKARLEASKAGLDLPRRILITNYPNVEALLELMDSTIREKAPISIDIEGGVNTMSCCSIADQPSFGYIVPFSKVDGSHYWDNIEDEILVWDKFIQILADPTIPKVLQNALYDTFVNQYSYNIVIKGVVEDTMLKHWELYCELEKALGVQTSIYCGTEPYYKFERKSDDQETFYRYCCKDSAITMEIAQKLEKYLDSGQKAHYHAKVASLNIFRYMMCRGIRYNQPLADTRLVEMKDHVYGYQEKLDLVAKEHQALSPIDYDLSRSTILSHVQSICCYKKDGCTPKKEFIERGYEDVLSILSRPNSDSTSLSNKEKGQISVLCKTTMNTKGGKFKDFLYGTLGLPTQWKKDLKTKEMRPTTDYKSLLKLSKSHPHPALNIALELSRLRTRAQMLAIKSVNGRMHCSYNAVGSETERVTSSKSPIYIKGGKRVGANMQTIPDDWDLEDDEHPLTQGMRDLLQADPGCYLCKCDLKGADGWTIGAYMAMLGDRTMLDDLLFGLKPAQIVAYILKHGASSIYGKDRHVLKEMVKEIKKDDWEYFVSKQGIWGTCYTMGPRKLAEQVFIESEGKVNLSESEAKTFQAAIFVRYNVRILHRWMENHMLTQPYPAKLIAPNGFTRKFFARNFGAKPEVLGEALAHLPQVITTYATNTAAYRLWTDPDNRPTPTTLRCEPMHQVHDELLIQFHIEDTEWAKVKIKEWFNNPMIIAGQKITIPYDGSYGTNWAMDSLSKIGSL